MGHPRRERETKRRSDAHLAALIDQTIAGIAETDLTGRFILANDRYREIVGYRRNELLAGLRMQDITHPDDLAANLEQFERLVATGEPFVIEKRYVRKDGAIAWVHNSVSAVRDEAGRVASVLAVVVDITERKRAEAEQRANEARLRALADATASAIWTASPTGDVLDQTTERWAVLTDLPTEELAAEWLAAVHPDDREPGNARWQAGIAEGLPFEFEQRIRQCDGTYRHFIVRAVPVRGGYGRIQEWIGADVDVTHRKRAEAELRERDELLRLTLQAARAGAWAVDLATDQDEWSPEVYPLLGRSSDEIAPAFANLLAILHPDDRDWLRDKANADIAAGREGQSEFRVVWPDGSVHWILARGRTIVDAAGQPRRVGLFLDITERKQAEEALHASEERQAFLLRLSDALRPLDDPVAVQGEASRLVGERLGADRTYYVELDDERRLATVARDYVRGDIPSLAGSHDYAAFGSVLATLRDGLPFVAEDAATDPRISPADRSTYAALALRSFVSMPLIKAGRLVAAMCVTKAVPRAWTPEEVAQLHEVAERTWEAVERARAETALRGSQERYRTLFDRIDQGFCIFEMIDGTDGRPHDYRFLEVNPTFERHTGLKDAVGRTARELVPSLEDYWVDIYGQVAATGERQRFEQGSAAMGRWFEVEAVRIGGEGSRRVALLFSDVTERKRTDETLRANEERLRLGIDVAGFALLEIDYDAGVIHLSAEAARLYGVGDAAVTVPREQVHATFHPDDRDALLRRIAQSPGPDAAEPYTTEYRVLWPSGDVRWLSVRKQAIFTNDGDVARPARAILAALDITERKQAEADRQALLDALAHDLRNPLTALKIQAQLLLRQFDRGRAPERDVLAERVASFLDLALRMTGLIDDLEEHAHLGIGGGEPERRPTDLVALARDSVEELQQSSGAHAIRLEADEPELVGVWDPLQVRRVLENLLGNAVKYSPAGSEVLVRLSRSGRYAAIEVRDEGIGIPAADLPHIFAFRHRGGNVGEVAGSGVGLAGVQQIVERHGGTVSVQSEEGRGSVFTVRLPLLMSGR